MNRGEYLHLLGEKTALERMLAETPEEDVIDRASLAARLESVEQALAEAKPDEREPARVRLTFKGRPVIGSHGIFAEFGMKAVNGFTEAVAAMAASAALRADRDALATVVNGVVVIGQGRWSSVKSRSRSPFQPWLDATNAASPPAGATSCWRAHRSAARVRPAARPDRDRPDRRR